MCTSQIDLEAIVRDRCDQGPRHLWNDLPKQKARHLRGRWHHRKVRRVEGSGHPLEGQVRLRRIARRATCATETPGATVWKQMDRILSGVQNRFVRRTTPSPCCPSSMVDTILHHQRAAGWSGLTLADSATKRSFISAEWRSAEMGGLDLNRSRSIPTGCRIFFPDLGKGTDFSGKCTCDDRCGVRQPRFPASPWPGKIWLIAEIVN